MDNIRINKLNRRIKYIILYQFIIIKILHKAVTFLLDFSLMDNIKINQLNRRIKDII